MLQIHKLVAALAEELSADMHKRTRVPDPTCDARDPLAAGQSIYVKS